MDIAPNWLASEATAHSKMGRQREERIQSEMRRLCQQKGDQKGLKGAKAPGGQKGGGRF